MATAADDVALADVEGTWNGAADGKPVSLTIGQGQAVMLAEGSICQGTATQAEHVELALSCQGGAAKRTKGVVESADGEQLVVVWESGTRDTLAQAPDAAPTGLPSGIPTDFPSGLPSVPPLLPPAHPCNRGALVSTAPS